MAVNEISKKRKTVPADDVKLKKRRAQPGEPAKVKRKQTSEKSKSHGEDSVTQRLSKKTITPVDGTAPTRIVKQKTKIIKKTPATAKHDDTDGGVPISLGTEQSQVENIEDDFKGFASDSDSETDGGALLSNDHTAELLKGFESSSEDEDEERSETLGRSAQGSDGETPADEIPSLPQAAQSAIANSSKARGRNNKDPPITLYIGRIPRGFFEHQIRAYFSQFGDITHLRLAHNRRTGAHKHFGFIQFESGEVGRIVQRTMQGYIMFGHILQVKEVPQSKLTELEAKGVDIWKGEGKRFKPMPWRDIQKKDLRTATREGWSKRVAKENERRVAKAEKLKKLGYEFEMPQLKSVDSVPVYVPEEQKEDPTKPAKDASDSERNGNDALRQKQRPDAEPRKMAQRNTHTRRQKNRNAPIGTDANATSVSSERLQKLFTNETDIGADIRACGPVTKTPARTTQGTGRELRSDAAATDDPAEEVKGAKSTKEEQSHTIGAALNTPINAVGGAESVKQEQIPNAASTDTRVDQPHGDLESRITYPTGAPKKVVVSAEKKDGQEQAPEKRKSLRQMTVPAAA